MAPEMPPFWLVSSLQAKVPILIFCNTLEKKNCSSASELLDLPASTAF